MPVLSVAITFTMPIESSARILVTRALCLANFLMLNANTIVIATGNPSGTTDTISAKTNLRLS